MKDVWQVITATSAVIWQHCFDVLLIIVLTSSLSITFCMYFLFCTIRKITSEYSKRERNERIGKNKDKRSMQKYYGHDRSILQHWHRKKFWFKTETITKRCRRFAPHTHTSTRRYIAAKRTKESYFHIRRHNDRDWHFAFRDNLLNNLHAAAATPHSSGASVLWWDKSTKS